MKLSTPLWCLTAPFRRLQASKASQWPSCPQMDLPRSAAAQRAVGAASAWGCGACGRRYAAPPAAHPGAEGGSGGAGFAPGLPRCPVCGVRVARAVPPTLLPEVGL